MKKTVGSRYKCSHTIISLGDINSLKWVICISARSVSKLGEICDSRYRLKDDYTLPAACYKMQQKQMKESASRSASPHLAVPCHASAPFDLLNS